MIDLPIRFFHSNLLVGRGRGEYSALYKIECESYEGLAFQGKLSLADTLDQFAYSLESDFALWRISREWPVTAYSQNCDHILDPRHGQSEQWQTMLANDSSRLTGMASTRPQLYLAVALKLGKPSLKEELGGLLSGIEERFGFGPKPGIAESTIKELARQEDRTFARIQEFFLAERAGAADIQRLYLRALCRGLDEPEVDPNWQPNALVVLDGSELCWQPAEHDLLRLNAARVTDLGRSLKIESELGASYQSYFALGALPEESHFPGDEAELLHAPAASLPFPVDTCFQASWIANRQAVAKVKRKIVDADNEYKERDISDHGADYQSAQRTQDVRALDEYLNSQARPPLLKSFIGLAVGAQSSDELELRVDALQKAYGQIKLHRLAGGQALLAAQHLPGQISPVRQAGRPQPALSAYTDFITTQQFGTFMPVATNEVGSDTGVYIGHTIRGRIPVLWDPNEASSQSRPPSMLLAGTLGSGKTITAQLLARIAAISGSIVCDVDPKQDHTLDTLPELAGRCEVIELGADQRYCGLLDPMRIAKGTDLIDDLATNFLQMLLPKGSEDMRPASRIRKAVVEARKAGSTSLVDVVEALHAGDRIAKECAQAVENYTQSGLAQLAFSAAGGRADDEVAKPVTCIKVRNLPLPTPGTARSDFTEQERIGLAIQQLLAAYTMKLVSGDRSRHKLLLFDEAWFLLASSEGRRLIDQLNRWGRSENATIILCTQLLRDVGEIENLVGFRMIFGLETDHEAKQALNLLGLDDDDPALVAQVKAQRRGRNLFKDIYGRVASVQIDVEDELLAHLNTTPSASGVGV